MSKDDESDRGVDWLTSQFGNAGRAKPEPTKPIEPAEPTKPTEPAEPIEPIKPTEPAEPVGAPSAATSVPPIAPFRRRRDRAAPPASVAPGPVAPEPPAPEPPAPVPPAPVQPHTADAPAVAEPESAGFDSVLRSARTQAELEPEPWWTTPVPAADAAPAEEVPPNAPPVETPARVPENSGDGATHTSSAHALPADLHLGATLPAPLGTAGAAASTAEGVEGTGIEPTGVEPTGLGSGAPVSSRHSSAPASRTATRAVIWVGAVLLAAIVLVGLFLLGQRLAGTAAPVAVATPTSSATPTPTPTPTPTAEVTAMQPAGEHSWNTLFGGECLQPYVSPWEENFTVSDCATAHGAQLVYRGSFGGDASTVFPGEAALAAQMNVLCSAPGVLDLAAAGAYPDLQVQGSYPITEEQWADTARNYYCFVSRSSAEPLNTSVAGPGPTA